MNLHEFQAKNILQKYGIPMPPFYVVSTLDEAKKIVDKMAWDEVVIKVQVHAGGRGKAGGVKIAKTRDQILSYVEQMLGMKIVNQQTGPSGVIAHQLLISPLETLHKQYYLGMVIDRRNAVASLIASPEGGVEIEEIAAAHPERILTVPLGWNGSFRKYQLMNIAKFMGWNGALAEQGAELVNKLAKAFLENDASLLEINPLALTGDNRLTVIDAKLSIDDNALYRHPQLAALYDPTQVTERENQAKIHDLAYVALEGDIGCMVNGAGLAMATMDAIYLFGGKPANFLDVGGGASQEKVAEGFKIILSDKNVKAILVNIFGGIMNCATLAGGIIVAVGELDVKVPLVVRMEGTNVDQGRTMLRDSKLNIITARGMNDAAEKVVKSIIT